MFERFTDRARRVVVLAQEEARDLGHGYIGTEHILLGLIREREGVAARALEALGLSLDAVREEVQVTVETGTGQPAGHIPFTPRAKKVLELSLREALQLGHNYIGTEHILLGLIREGEGVAAQVLVSLGADLNRVRQQVIRLLHGARAQAEAASEGDEPEEPAPRRVVAAQAAMGMRPAGPRSAAQLDAITARLHEMASKLEVIADRLTSIENLLAEGRRPVARAPRRPPAPGRPPLSRKPKQPPVPSAGADAPPSGAASSGTLAADAPPAGAPAAEAPHTEGPHPGVPPADAPPQKPPAGEAPEGGAPEGGAPEGGAPEGGAAQQG